MLQLSYFCFHYAIIIEVFPCNINMNACLDKDGDY